MICTRCGWQPTNHPSVADKLRFAQVNHLGTFCPACSHSISDPKLTAAWDRIRRLEGMLRRCGEQAQDALRLAYGHECDCKRACQGIAQRIEGVGE